MEHPPALRRREWRLIDTVVIMVVVAVAVALLLPAVVKVRGGNDVVSRCMDNMHNIGLGIHSYSDMTQDRFPPMLDFDPSDNGSGWMPFWFSLLPELEASRTFDRARGTGAGWGAGNHAATIKILLCPADDSAYGGICTSGAKGWAGTSYAPNYFLFGTEDVFDAKKGVNITHSRFTSTTLPKGNSHTIAVVERLACFPKYGWSNATFYPMSHSYWGFNGNGSVYGAWGAFPPRTRAKTTGDNAVYPTHPSTGHTTMQVLLADGSVRSVSGNISPTIWEKACKPDEDWLFGNDWLP